MATGSSLTLSLSILGTVSPGDSTLVAQLFAHHVGQLDVHLVVTHRPPCVVVQHLHAPFVWLAREVSRQSDLGGRCAWRPALRARGPPRLRAREAGEGQQRDEQEEEEGGGRARGEGHPGGEEGSAGEERDTV